MREVSKTRPDMKDFDWDTPSPALSARMRMATLPSGEGVRNLYVEESMWVPVCVVNYNVHVLPGIPRIFVQLLEGLGGVWASEGRLPGERSKRVMISTPLQESVVAEYLAELQRRVEGKVKVGSYPRWGKKRNTVTLVGDAEVVDGLVEEVEREVKGKRVESEGDADEGEGEGV